MSNFMIYSIVPAAGSSKRFGKNKLEQKILGKSILSWAVEKLYELGDVIIVRSGGKTRQETVWKGLRMAKEMGAKKGDIVVVHNGSNPFVTRGEIKQCIMEAKKYGACAVARAVTDTIKNVEYSVVQKTIRRDGLMATQTPQAIEFELFWKAHERARKNCLDATDDVALVENIGRTVKIIEASERNFKITTREDLERAKLLAGDVPQDFRSGIGHDSHKFSRRGTLRLGGVKIGGYKKLEANSDGDAVLHAAYNAIAQALGEKSLGDVADKLCAAGEKNSAVYIGKILTKMRSAGYVVHHCGISIEGRNPRIDPIEKRLRESMGELLGIETESIGITATTGEDLTPFGRGEGVQCFVSVTLKKTHET